MAIQNDFHVDRRVSIAMDAMTASQQAAIKSVLVNKEGFIAHEKRPGVSRKLSVAKSLYTMRAGPGLRVIYSKHDDQIIVLDVMRKVTMDRYVLKRKHKAAPKKKKSQTEVFVERDEASEVVKG